VKLRIDLRSVSKGDVFRSLANLLIRRIRHGVVLGDAYYDRDIEFFLSASPRTADTQFSLRIAMTTTSRSRFRHRLGSLRFAVGADPYPIWEDLRQRPGRAHDRLPGLVPRPPGVSEIGRNENSRVAPSSEWSPTSSTCRTDRVAPPITRPPFTRCAPADPAASAGTDHAA